MIRPLLTQAILALVLAVMAPGFAHAECMSGRVSWYGPGFHGRLTANGEVFDQEALTAAHRTLPFGSLLRVWRGDRSITVTVNDRGPFVAGRALDLSRAAASALGIIAEGVATLCIERLR